ncbi:MAG: TIGR04282 family arsenosugar biosynthesis glycosyltransferase [Oceanococcus sp.]
MTKAPIPGRCKTRLAPRLGLRGAARLQRQLIQQRLQLALSIDCPVEIHASPDLRHPVFLSAKRLGIKLRKQVAGDLGRRMSRAQGDRPAIIIGTDCPSLTKRHLDDACQALLQNQQLCIPATDGGYVLIAQTHVHPQLFQTIHWGSAQVFRQTRRQQRRSGARWLNTAALDDLDSPRDFLKQRKSGFLPAF